MGRCVNGGGEGRRGRTGATTTRTRTTTVVERLLVVVGVVVVVLGAERGESGDGVRSVVPLAIMMGISLGGRRGRFGGSMAHT